MLMCAGAEILDGFTALSIPVLPGGGDAAGRQDAPAEAVAMATASGMKQSATIHARYCAERKREGGIGENWPTMLVCGDE